DDKFAFSSTYPMQPHHVYSIFTPEHVKDPFFTYEAGMNDFEIHEAPAPEIVEIAEYQKEDDAESNVFVHPTSGVKFDLQPGDKVWKHKTTPNGYIIEQAEGDTPIHFF